MIVDFAEKSKLIVRIWDLFCFSITFVSLMMECLVFMLGMDAEQHQPAVQGDPSRAKTVINNKRENAPQRARKTILKSYGAG